MRKINWKYILQYFNQYVNKVYGLRAHSGPYRHLVRDWKKINDINLLINILGTDYFRRQLDPVPLPIEKMRSILVIAPHQDDEAIGAGGALLLASKAKVQIDILFVTDGIYLGSDYSLEELGRIRNDEATEVCNHLGATMHNLGISNYDPQPNILDVERLGSIINDIKPEVVMIPWFLDYPPKHRLANHLLYLAQQHVGLENFEVWGYQVHNTPYPNGYIDISSVADEKLQLLRYYDSQNRLNHYDHRTMGLNAWNIRFLPKHPEKRFIEIFMTLPKDDYLELVGTYYPLDFEVTYNSKEKIKDAAQEIHNTIMA
jgi:N-acetylglucosamine malate deacetylase 1